MTVGIPPLVIAPLSFSSIHLEFSAAVPRAPLHKRSAVPDTNHPSTMSPAPRAKSHGHVASSNPLDKTAVPGTIVVCKFVGPGLFVNGGVPNLIGVMVRFVSSVKIV